MKLMEKIPCVYILANKRNGTIYVGVTSNLKRRIFKHKNNLIEGFTKRYKIHSLIYYEVGDSMEGAIEKEKNKLKIIQEKRRYHLLKMIIQSGVTCILNCRTWITTLSLVMTIQNKIKIK